MQLTKTDFIHYLNCPKSLWLEKHEPERFPRGEFTAQEQKLAREGREVEACLRQLFRDQGRENVEYERVFETEDGLYARVDAFEITPGGKTVLYEVKSSTEVKRNSKHNQLKDAGFQKLCVERAGQPVDRVVIVHVNGDYVKQGPLDLNALLVFADVTDDVNCLETETAAQIDDALNCLAGTIDPHGCGCRSRSRRNHCDAFSVFNPDVPTPSIHDLPRVNSKRLRPLLDQGVLELSDIPPDADLTDPQALVAEAARRGTPLIDPDGIRQFLESIDWPLYFLDFETFGTAVPHIDGSRPHGQFPVQYSLHVLEPDGTLTHREYLERQARLPRELTERLIADLGPTGSVLAWSSFEHTQLGNLAKLFPEHAHALGALQQRIRDLSEPFNTHYVDARFSGSTSIKNVLPVLCPGLTYSNLHIQDGGSAMDAWARMLEADSDEADAIAQDLLLYCERDTEAMVEIYRVLASIASQPSETA